MKKSALLLVVLICIGFAACNKSERSAAIYSEKFTINNFREIANKIKSSDDMPSEDINYLTNALKRLSFSPDSVVGKTVKDLIEFEQKYLNQMTKKSLSEMSDISMLRLNTKNLFVGVLPSSNKLGEPINNLYFEFDNKYNKPLKAIAGEIVFFYRQDSASAPVQLEPLPFSFDKEIAANAKDTLIFYHKHNADDKISQIIRNETRKLSGLLNITKVEY